MPTAAKLFAAFAFAVLAFFAAEVFKPHMSEGTQFGAFVPISALIGLVSGWRVMGPAAGQGNWMAVNNGIKTAVCTLFLALIIFSVEGMLVLAFRRAYDGPMDAIIGIFGVGVDYLLQVLVWDVMAVLLIGGALGGLLSEWAARRWR